MPEKKAYTITGLTKDQALREMQGGAKIRHHYYTEREFLYMKEGVIYDENNYVMGTPSDHFWQNIQKWADGWETIFEY